MHSYGKDDRLQSSYQAVPIGIPRCNKRKIAGMPMLARAPYLGAYFALTSAKCLRYAYDNDGTGVSDHVGNKAAMIAE